MLWCPFLSAMERSCVMTRPKRLVITNSTTWKLSILYTYDDALVGATVIPQGELILVDPLNLQVLQAVPSGKLLSHTQLTKPDNLTSKLEDKVEEHCCITISAHQELYKILYPFIYDPGTMTQKELNQKIAIPESKLLKDAFQNAWYALTHEKVMPFPRHYLGISLQNPRLVNTLKLSIKAAYERLIAYWANLKQSDPDFVGRVRRILAQAKLVLDNQLDLQEDPIVQKHLKSTPVSLKDRIKDLSDEDIEDAHKKLCEKWKELLSKEHTQLLDNIIAHLTSEKEFLAVHHWLDTNDFKDDSLDNLDKETDRSPQVHIEEIFGSSQESFEKDFLAVRHMLNTNDYQDDSLDNLDKETDRSPQVHIEEIFSSSQKSLKKPLNFSEDQINLLNTILKEGIHNKVLNNE